MPFPFDRSLFAMLSSAPVAIAVFDRNFNYLYHTLEWSSLYRFGDTSLIGLNHFEQLSESNEQWLHLYKQALHGETILTTNEVQASAEAPVCYIDTEIRPWHDDLKEIGGIVVVSRDVTSERKALVSADLANQRFEYATEAGSIGTMEYRYADDTLFLNNVALRLLDVSLLEFDQIDLDAVRTRLTPASVDKFNRALEISQSVKQGKCNLDVRRRDGSIHTLFLQLNVIQGADSRTGVIGTFTDITSELELTYKAEQALLESEAAYEELASHFATQQRMFAVIGHELRTPAAALKMLIDNDELLQTSPKLRVFQSTASQLIKVLDELKTVVQPTERLSSTLVPDSPASVVELVVRSLSPGLEHRGIATHISMSRNSHRICRFNVQGLRQIISNLIRNVEVHSGAKNIWIELHAAATKREPGTLWCQLVVSDDGRGIPAHHRDKIFAPFYRVDESKDGTGIGLNLCQNVASSLGGSISYEDRPDGGAQFVLNMMLEQYEEQASPSTDEEESRPPEPEVDPLNGKLILVAEDNKTIQMITKAVLMKAGAKAVVADDGQKALDMFNNNSLFDFVLTDIFMPERDGYGLVQALREIGYSKPIVGVTAATIGDEAQRLLDIGADAVLSKPLDLQELKNTLSRLVR